ncbi:MAG: caspase family protein [Deltaproteobacteria bacterium]|nr:caspase family protein [Deltaproteobacteria bacterium]
MWALVLASIAALAQGAGLPNLDTPLKTGAQAPADAAVVVGIEDYVFVADVPFAQRDARAFYDFLVYTRGIPGSRVRLFEGGVGREQIIEALGQAAAEVGDGGTLWVYFAGHGAADTSTGERMLLGDDVRQDPTAFGTRAVRLSEIRDIAADKDLMLILDACYNGMGRSGEELVAGKRFVVPTWASQPSPGRVEWTAAAPDELSGPLDAARHGAFTYFAIGALRGWADGELDGTRDGKVTAEEADLYVRQALRTVQVSTQTPVLTASDLSSVVLSHGTEAAPELGVPTATPTVSGTSVPGLLDASDMALMDTVLQDAVDRCTEQNRTGTEAGDLWYIRFKTKKGEASGMWLADARPESQQEEEVDPSRGSRGLCIRRELKLLRFTDDTVVVQRTMSPSNPE